MDNFDTLNTAAAEMGTQHGTAAGSWVIDGNTSDETCRTILSGIDNGDPAVLDSLPGSPLSGEWADGMTPLGLLRALGVEDPHNYPDDDADALCDAYEQAYSDAVVGEVERACRVQTGS